MAQFASLIPSRLQRTQVLPLPLHWRTYPHSPGEKKIDCTRAEFKSGVSSQKVEEKNWDRNEMIVTVTSADRPRSARRSRHGRGTRQGLDVGRVYVRTPYTNTRTGQLDTSRAFGGGAQLIPKVWARIEPRMRAAPAWPLCASADHPTNNYRFFFSVLQVSWECRFANVV